MEERRNPCISIPRSTVEAVLRANVTARIVDAVAKNTASEVGSPQIHAVAVENNPCFSFGCSSDTSLVDNFMNFKKSGAPSRFLFFRNDAWGDISREVFGVLREGFQAGNTTLEVPIDGSLYMFDFLRMSRIDLTTGSQVPIAWIDDNGKCFFPKRFMGDGRTPSSPGFEIQIRMDSGYSKPSGGSLQSKRMISSGSPQEYSDESPEITCSSPKWTGAGLLNEGDNVYQLVDKLFLAGMRRFDLKTTVTSIYRCSHIGHSGNSRLKAFQMQRLMTKAARGIANVKYGWYGTSAEDVNSVITHGFGQPSNSFWGSKAHGIGIYLSPPHSPHTSSFLSEADENGERHVILCRVIMGNAEKVENGSLQFHPSSLEFDSGVDDLENPKCYTVWSTHMNRHILPEFVVSFRSKDHPQGQVRSTIPTRRISPHNNLSFAKLFAELGGSLPSSRMQALEFLYSRYKARRMSREIFSRQLRSVVNDDKLLISIAKKIKDHF